MNAVDRPADRCCGRRAFLKTAALAAGSAVAPYVITSQALGGEGRPPASDRVVLGYLGVGPRGIVNVRDPLACPDAQLVAVCDVWKNRRDQAKGLVDGHYQNQDCRAYRDFRDIIARDDIDAVGIASTDHWHVPMTIAAARAGKDVHVEKPLGVCIAEDLACRDAIRRFGRVFQYGTEARSMAAGRQGAELVRNGAIGEIREIHVTAPNSVRGGSHQPKPVPSEALGPDATRLPVSPNHERNFIDCVKSRATPVSNLDDAVRSDIISHVCDIAVREGRKIVWDPASEQILNDPAAARRCSRALREPWQW